MEGGSMAKKKKVRAFSPNVRDYPSSMSQYERESLAAEAILNAKKKPSKKRAV
jgi:hypothetical protein